MLLDFSRDLKRLQLTIKFIAAQFKILIGIIAIYIFANILNKAICYGTGAVATEYIYLKSLQDITRLIIRVKGVRR